VKPEVTGPRKHLVIRQRWTVPKGVTVRRSGDTVVIPVGRTYYIRPRAWKTLHIPWKLELSECNCSWGSTLNMSGILSSVMVEKTGAMKINVYNTRTEVVCIPARTLGIRLHGVGSYEVEGLPNEDQGDINRIEGGTTRSISGQDEATIRRSLMGLFPTVFDMTEHPVSPAMKALRVKPDELPDYHQVPAGGKQCTFRIDQQVRDQDIEAALEQYEKLGYISRVRLNDRVFLSPLMPFMKPGKMDIRVVNDFRELNGYFPTQGRTQIDVRRVMDKVPAKWRFFSVIDLKDGFFSVPLDPAIRHLFSFQFGHRRWVYNRLPQGFSFSPIFFSERVAQIIEGTQAINFADDLIVGGETPEDHHENLCATFRRLKKFGLKVNSNKMKLFRREITFLRYSLSNGQWSLSDYLADKWKQLGEVCSRRDLERHIGILSFARTHVPEVEKILRPLREHLKRAKSLRLLVSDWGFISSSVRSAYRSCLGGHVPLSFVNDRFSKFLLYTDWTDFHIGYMLFGVSAETGNTKLVDIGSHGLPMTTSSYLGELTGIVIALKKTRRLRGQVTTVVLSDNQGVIEKLKTGMATSDDVRVCRRLEYILHNEANAEFRFVPGTENGGADALSRLIKQKAKITGVNQVTQTDRPPFTEIKRRIEHAHFGHWSTETTYQNAKMEFGEWPGLYKDVIKFVGQCENCAYSGQAQYRDNYSAESVDQVGQRVHLDYTGPFFDGSHLLVIVDAFSRYVQVSRTAHIGAAHAVRELRRWMDRFGPIQELCGDNASSWNSTYFKKWTEGMQIRLRLTPSHFHSGNATVERAIQTLQGRIRRWLNGSSVLWPEVIDAAAQAMNESWHSAIETCPQSLARGIRRDGTLLTLEESQEVWSKALEAQAAAKRKELERFTWKHPRLSAGLRIGDQVLLRDPLSQTRSLGKLSPRWRGPFIVRDRASRSTWWISGLHSQSAPFRVHSSQIRVFRGN